jgi:hypothetical protein
LLAAARWLLLWLVQQCLLSFLICPLRRLLSLLDLVLNVRSQACGPAAPAAPACCCRLVTAAAAASPQLLIALQNLI